MSESYTPREFIEKINTENPGPVFDPYGVEGLVKNQEQSPAQDMLDQAKAEVAKEQAKTPEDKIAELQQQVDAMKQWLIQEGTYKPEDLESWLSLRVEYNEAEQRAEIASDYDLRLDKLKQANGLKLPDNIGGTLGLDGLESAEGLELPKNIGKHLYMDGLTSADGLQLPDSISGYVHLGGLSFEERERIRGLGYQVA